MEHADDDLDLKTLATRLAVGLAMLFLGVGLLGFALKEPIEALARVFVDQLGYVGLFSLVALVDTLPLTHEPVIFLGYSGGLGFVPVWLVSSAGSVAGGLLGWFLGGRFGHLPAIQRKLQRYRIQAFLDRYGASAVAIAALTPFPYAVATWAAGAAGVPFRTVFLGTLARIPKVLFYLGLMAAGWMGAS